MAIRTVHGLGADRAGIVPRREEAAGRPAGAPGRCHDRVPRTVIVVIAGSQGTGTAVGPEAD